MRPISVHVRDEDYREFKALSVQTGKPVAFLIREAMEKYLGQNKAKLSLLDIHPHPSGSSLAEWDRSELFDDMIGP